jgi:hypothetical protein
MGLGIVRQADQYGLDDGVHAPGEYEAPEDQVDPRRDQRPQRPQPSPAPSVAPAPSVMAQRQGPRIHAGTMSRVSRETLGVSGEFPHDTETPWEDTSKPGLTPYHDFDPAEIPGHGMTF